MTKALQLFVKSLSKEQKIKTLFQLIQQGIEKEGGDFSRIQDMISALAEFEPDAKRNGVDCSLWKIVVADKDLFHKNREVKLIDVVKNEQDTVGVYGKKKDRETYAAAVGKYKKENIPVVYMGSRSQDGAVHYGDTFLACGQDKIIFCNKSISWYDEIPLHSSGTHAEFLFTGDKLCEVNWKKLANPRLGFWGPEHHVEL